MKCVICGREFEARRKWGGEVSPCCDRRWCKRRYRDMKFCKVQAVTVVRTEGLGAREIRRLSRRQLLEYVRTGRASVLAVERELARRLARKKHAADKPKEAAGD